MRPIIAAIAVVLATIASAQTAQVTNTQPATNAQGQVVRPLAELATRPISVRLSDGIGFYTASGGTGSTFGAAFPATGVAVGARDAGGLMAGMNLDTSGNLRVSDNGMIGFLDPNNSTTTPLGANGTWTGTATDTLPYASVNYSIQSDVISATNGIIREWSHDGVSNWFTWSADNLASDRIGNNTATDMAERVHARYFRLRYVNGATPQTYFRIQTILYKTLSGYDTMGVDHAPKSGDDAILTKSVLTGKTTAGGGSYVDVKVNPSGTLVVDATGSTVGITSSVLPTGAATEATLATRLAEATFTARVNTLGQKASTASMPVVIASDQSPVPITDGSGALNVIVDSGTLTAVTSITNPVTVTGTVTATPTGTQAVSTAFEDAVGTPVPATAAVVAGTDGTNSRTLHTDTSGDLQVDVLTMPTTTVTGTITAVTSITNPVTITSNANATAIDTGTCTNVTASATILASNAARKVAIILNNGTAAVHVKLGATATTANPPLAPGQSLTIEGTVVYTGVIDVIASTGTQNVCAYSW